MARNRRIENLEVSGDENGNKRLLINDQDAIIAKLNALSSKMEELERENTILKQRMDTMKKSGIELSVGENGCKRLLIDDQDVIMAELKTLSSKVLELTSKVSTLERENTNLRLQMDRAKQGGSTYTRWGRKDCPLVNGTYLVYTGIAGGGSYGESGSGIDYLCLPHDPEFAPADFPTSLVRGGHYGRIWGAEYQFSYGNVKVDDDVPCAVCVDTLATTSIMIAAKTACPSQWRKQYSGFLTANYFSQPAASEYACVDEDPQYFDGRRSNLDGKLFYPVLTVCGSLPCPPYENSKYLKCVVCSY